MKGVDGRRIKIEVFVKLPGCFVDRVNHDGPTPYDVRSLFDSLEGIEQESLPNTFSLLVDINRQAGEKYDSDGMIREPF